VDGFSFDFYEIIEKVIIYVESIDSKMEEEVKYRSETLLFIIDFLRNWI